MSQRSADRLTISAAVMGLVAVVGLAVLAHSAAYFPIDLYITVALQRLQSPVLDQLALSLDWLGYAPQVMIWLALIVLALFAAGQRWESVVLLLSGALEAGVATGVKLLVRRPRPEVAAIHIYRPLGDYTFPSGHAFSFVMVFGLLAYFAYIRLPPSWLRTLVMTILIGLVVAIGPVRIYLGAHWLSDVAAGYLLGGLGLLLMARLYRWGQGRFFKRRRTV